MNDLTKSDTVALVVEAVKNHGDEIDWGLRKKLAFHAEDVPLPTGRVDLLIIDNDRQVLYVVEIVPGEAGAEDVGRLLGHCGWLKKDLNPKVGDVSSAERPDPKPTTMPAEEVKGILLASSFGAGAQCALGLCDELRGMRHSFSLRLGLP